MKRIGRIAKDETLIVDMISEDLQDLYNKREETRDDACRAREISEEENTEEAHRLFHYAASKALRAEMDFWAAVHEKHGHWKDSVGIRDNYALVKCSKKSKMKGFGGFGDFIRDIKKAIEDEIDGGEAFPKGD